MTTKHTPGPWRVNPGANEVRGADWNVIVADVGIDADAHLIAAAPDLLAASITMMWCVDAGYTVIKNGEVRDAQTQLAVEAIRAAIAKAQGKKP